MVSTTAITDIHAHILPNLDDGPSNLEETTNLLAAFRESGVERIISTTHYRHPHFSVARSDLQAAYERLTAEGLPELERDESPLEFALGAEVRLCPELKTDIRNQSVPTLGNTPYVLVEFPSAEIPKQTLEIVYELTILDMYPIMAHPERNRAIQRNPRLLDEMMHSGLCFQLTAGCFIPKSNQQSQSLATDKLAWRILEAGRATVIASDAHNTATRPPLLTAAYEQIGQQLGESIVDRLVENANAIWFGEPCLPVVPGKPKKRRIWWFR